jgi:hypothetical protein
VRSDLFPPPFLGEWPPVAKDDRQSGLWFAVARLCWPQALHRFPAKGNHVFFVFIRSSSVKGAALLSSWHCRPACHKVGPGFDSQPYMKRTERSSVQWSNQSVESQGEPSNTSTYKIKIFSFPVLRQNMHTFCGYYLYLEAVTQCCGSRSLHQDPDPGLDFLVNLLRLYTVKKG